MASPMAGRGATVVHVYGMQHLAAVRGGFCEERPGPPRVGHSQLQRPTTGTAEPFSHDGGDSVITYLRKGKNAAEQL